MSNDAGSPPFPDWAIERARASLRIGVKVPDIEQGLIAHGLTAETATSLVTSVLEDRIQQEVKRKERAELRLRLHRILSGLVVGVYLVVVYRIGGVGLTLYYLLPLLLPLACIWFADQMGSATGPTGILSPYITFPTPGVFVRVGGWLVLILVWIYRLISLLN